MSKSTISKHSHELCAVKDILQSIAYDRIVLSDSPDVVVVLKDGKHIGIEVMDCVVSSIRSQNKRNRVRVVQNIYKAEEEYKKQLIEKGKTNISVRLSFTDKILDAPQKGFTEKVIDEINRHLSNDRYEDDFYTCIVDKDFRDKYERIDKEGGFNYDYIEFVECFEDPSIQTQVYHLCCFCFLGDIEEKDVEECLKKKEPLLEKYKALEKNSDIDEYWLAIWVPSEEYMNFDDYQPKTDIESGYSRIYISYPFNACKRIK